ncbi:GCN5-related N-acetyltransferase [Rhizorhabdus wittichii RW1]|uniref:GCN5-related N-acetyltransferase n=1 Tax=Rhizorhabdus wittichii (strain DSM 6014 / CCUG 31198 / JCM 15750 / NBRC 105917 / EY 4224 / RW1) TaxID=392499 RepID=A0A9J9LD59_RHIWR|nr:GCN5-related N-acetyltransferase [Rhizorhabdus wittichii RW1]
MWADARQTLRRGPAAGRPARPLTRIRETGLTAPMEPSPNHIEWRGAFTNDEVNALHAECFDHRPFDDDWWSQVNRFSLGWVSLRHADALIGFVNVAWDGGVHAFILDTMVSTAFRRRGLAKMLIDEAVAQAKRTGCEWLHVDFDPHLHPFYFEACGFTPTDAGLIPLR